MHLRAWLVQSYWVRGIVCGGTDQAAACGNRSIGFAENLLQLAVLSAEVNR